jgi:predicted metal-dependent peptidase
MRHVTRAKQFVKREDATLWNLCTDCIINYALGANNDNINLDFINLRVPEGIVTFESLSEKIGEDIPKTQVLDSEVKDWSAEALFKYVKTLINQSPQKEQIQKFLDGQGQKNGIRSDSKGGGDGEEEKSQESQGGTLLGDLSEEDFEEGVPEYQKEDDLPDADSGRIGDMIWSKRVKAAAGQDPLGVLKTLVGDLPEVKPDWRRELRRFLSTQLLPEPKTDWSRPHRRVLSGDCEYFMPNRGRRRGIKNIIVFHDASGSCWHDDIFSEFLANIESIQQTMKANLTYITFDFGLQSFQKVPFDGRPLSERVEEGEIELHGGGGTDFQAPINYLVGNPADVAIIFTDGMASEPTLEETLKTPLIWAIKENDNFTPPFGELVNVEKPASDY